MLGIDRSTVAAGNQGRCVKRPVIQSSQEAGVASGGCDQAPVCLRIRSELIQNSGVPGTKASNAAQNWLR